MVTMRDSELVMSLRLYSGRNLNELNPTELRAYAKLLFEYAKRIDAYNGVKK